MAPPVSYYGIQTVDFSKEISSVVIGVNTLNAANLVTQQTAHIAWRDAVDAVSLCEIVALDTTLDRHRTASTGGAASDNDAHREKKWVLRYHDSSDFTNYTIEIPGADLSLLESHSDVIDLLDPDVATVWTDLKTAFENIARSPNGNACVATEVFYTGRSL